MSRHSVNNKNTNFGRQAEDYDDNTPSAPASLSSVPSFGTLPSVPSFGTLPSVSSFGTLPSVPSFGTSPSVDSYGNEKWCQLHFNVYADASTTSANPIPPCSPGFASGASSAGIAGPYSTTPLPSTSIEIPRNGLASHLEASLQLQSAGSNSKKHAKFILEDPAMAKHKKDKAMRACTPCFTKRLECSESETPNRCRHCVGKTSYCKGPIETPRLLDLEWFDTTLAALLAHYYQSIGLPPDSEDYGSMDVDFRLELPCEQEIVSDRHTRRLQIPGLQDEFHFLREPSDFYGVLDAILPADGPLCIAPKPGLYDLSSYERLCRRLCACISLLRRPNECTLDNTYKNDHRATLFVVRFLRQLNRTASSILAEIFEHVRGCCFANRDRRGTPNLMFILAEHLGHLHRELRHLMNGIGQFSDSLPLTGLLLDASQNLNKLENLGRGLCPRAFESTYQSSVLDLARVHITPCFEPCPNNKTDDLSTLSQHISFVDILRNSIPYQYPTGNQPVPIICDNDTGKPWQNVDIETPTPLMRHVLQHDLPNGQDILGKNHTSFGVQGLQAEANAMLNPHWTLEFHAHDFSAETLDSMPHGQDVDWDQQQSQVQQVGHAYLEDTRSVPSNADIGSDILTSLHDIMEFSQVQSNTTQRLETVINTAMSNGTNHACACPIPTNAEVPGRASKRKLIKAAFSRKKPCLTSSRCNDSEGMGLATTDLLSKLAIRAESAAKTTTTGSTMSPKPPSDDYRKERIRAEWVPGWEQGRNSRMAFNNAGIFSDLRVSDSERRPMSWPHRNPWRKSLDISVAALTKGFERLMTERGETSLSAI